MRPFALIVSLVVLAQAGSVVVAQQQGRGAPAPPTPTLGLENGTLSPVIGREMPLEYRMHLADARWQVYDLSLDGISLVSNYRAQFNKVIRIDSYETLVTRLRSHQTEFAAPAASPSGKAR